MNEQQLRLHAMMDFFKSVKEFSEEIATEIRRVHIHIEGYGSQGRMLNTRGYHLRD